jgi:ribosomal protein S18 acetylase RimI-like enzyme
VTDVVVGRLDLVDDLAAVLDIKERALGEDPEGRSGRADIVRRHVTYAGHRAVGARDRASGRLLGFGYGCTSSPDRWWEGMIRSHLPEEDRDSWLDGAFELIELHVDPASQGQGLGRRLLTAVASGTGLPRIILTTFLRESAARSLYRSVGLHDLSGAVKFPGQPEPYVVMGGPLPLTDLPGRRDQPAT